MEVRIVSRRLRQACARVEFKDWLREQTATTYRAAIDEVTSFQMLEYLQKQLHRDGKETFLRHGEQLEVQREIQDSGRGYARGRRW